MRLLSSLSLPLRLSSLMLLGVVVPQVAAAQTVISDDYIYIGIEAEDHVVKNERWVLTTPSTPTEENDPDGNHSDQASGSTYLELLPDIRVTHADPFGPPLAYWGRGGEGPDADYAVNFPEAGRYYVHVRAYSTGTEDNGMHVGINGSWPETGRRMQWCSANKRAWWWSSAQRDSGGNGSCGIEKSIWIDVPSAGNHTVNISAREDGFEIDRLVLIKDLSNNTRICEPKNVNDVDCRNGSIESADGFVDLRVRFESVAVGADPEVEPPNPTEVAQGSNITLTALIENLDAFDTANDIVLTLSPALGEWNMIEMDDRCTKVDLEYKCTLDELHPTAPNEKAPFVFTMQSVVEGNLRIDGSVLSTEVDDSPSNDVAATVITVGEGTAPPLIDQDTDITVALNTDKDEYETGEGVQLTVAIDNIGANAAEDVLFSLGVPAGLTVDAGNLPSACTPEATAVRCFYASIPKTDSESIILQFLSVPEGLHTFTGGVSASNNVNLNNDLDSDSVIVTTPVVETTTEGTGEADSDTSGEVTAGGTTTDGTTDGTTGGSGETDGSATESGETDVSSGETAGTDGETTGVTATDASGSNDSSSGAATIWFMLMLVMLYSTRLYGRHQR